MFLTQLVRKSLHKYIDLLFRQDETVPRRLPQELQAQARTECRRFRKEAVRWQRARVSEAEER